MQRTKKAPSPCPLPQIVCGDTAFFAACNHANDLGERGQYRAFPREQKPDNQTTRVNASFTRASLTLPMGVADEILPARGASKWVSDSLACASCLYFGKLSLAARLRGATAGIRRAGRVRSRRGSTRRSRPSRDRRQNRVTLGLTVAGAPAVGSTRPAE